VRRPDRPEAGNDQSKAKTEDQKYDDGLRRLVESEEEERRKKERTFNF